MRSRSILSGVCLIALVLSPAHLLGQSVEREVRAAVQQYIAATNNGNPETLASLYLNAPTTGSIGDGSIYRGWSMVADLIDGIYRDVGTVGLSARNLEVTALGTDAAVAYFDADWSLGGAPPVSYSGAMTVVFVRTGQGWRVAHDHTSTLPGTTVISTPTPTARLDYQGGPSAPIRATTPCIVTRIVDGDTVDCDPHGRVRLLGIDTPESAQAPFGDIASEALVELIPPDGEVMLELDVERTDRYGRTLAYLWSDGTLLNWAMVRYGYAVVLTYPPNVQYVDWLEQAQLQARTDESGLWELDGFACPPVEYRRRNCRQHPVP